MHYNEFFQVLNPQECAGCGLKPVQGKGFNRHHPNPELFNRIHTTHIYSSFERLKSHSIINKSCYVFYTSMACAINAMIRVKINTCNWYIPSHLSTCSSNDTTTNITSKCSKPIPAENTNIQVLCSVWMLATQLDTGYTTGHPVA